MKVLSLTTAAGSAALIAASATSAVAASTINTGTYHEFLTFQTVTANGSPAGPGQCTGQTPGGQFVHIYLGFPGFNKAGGSVDFQLQVPGFAGPTDAHSVLPITPATYAGISTAPGWNGSETIVSFGQTFPPALNHFSYIISEDGTDANGWAGTATNTYTDNFGNICNWTADVVGASTSNSK